jgi:hypothetical protein
MRSIRPDECGLYELDESEPTDLSALSTVRFYAVRPRGSRFITGLALIPLHPIEWC